MSVRMDHMIGCCIRYFKFKSNNKSLQTNKKILCKTMFSRWSFSKFKLNTLKKRHKFFIFVILYLSL